jgi:hypothetical protein
MTQLGCIFCTLSCIPVLVIWWYTEVILSAFGISHTVARLAGEFARWSIPRMWPHCMYYCFKMFLSSQKIVMVDLVRLCPSPTGLPQPVSFGCLFQAVNIVMVPVNLLLNIIFVGGVHGFHSWGVKGSAIANVVARGGVLVSVFTVSYLKGYHKAGWGEWVGWCARHVLCCVCCVEHSLWFWYCVRRLGFGGSVACGSRAHVPEDCIATSIAFFA